jgi:hypothetical protein
MRGRYPLGPDGVRLWGSLQARQRLRVLLELLAGRWRVKDACAELGLRRSRLKQLHDRVLRVALAALEPHAGEAKAGEATPTDRRAGTASP